MSKRIPASIRNRNPGAMYPGTSSKKFGSTSFEWLENGKHKCATFPSDVQGAAALFDLLASSKYVDGKRTVREIITKWCGGYYVSTYLSVLEKKAGVTADTVLTRGLLCNPDIAIPLAQAMALQEAGQAYPLDVDGWRQAHTLALPTAASEAVTEVAPPEKVAPSPENEKPLSKPEERVADAKQNSWTLKAAIGSAWAWVMGTIEQSSEVFSSTSGTVESLAGGKTALGLAASAAKDIMNELFICMGLATVLIIVGRRLLAAEEGKTG
jgi:hypothetical protein